MKIDKICEQHKNLIKCFLNHNGMKGIVDDIDFTLLDKSPTKSYGIDESSTKSYYSYYCEVDGRKFGIIIDYDTNTIMIASKHYNDSFRPCSEANQ